MVSIISSERILAEMAQANNWTNGKPPYKKFADGVDLRNEFRTRTDGNGHTIAEFIGNSDFAEAWVKRQVYEVEMGRVEVPLLYPFVYNTITDSSLPKSIAINELGPGAVVFESVDEGGEVKFASVSGTNFAATMHHYAVGIEYDKDLVVYNELWNLGIAERQLGRAFNALQNHIAFSPLINYSYPAENTTAASTSGTTLAEKWTRTLEDAIIASQTDTRPASRRDGPYILLVPAGDRYMWERVLSPAVQQNVTTQSSVISDVQKVIAYAGWTGTRGKKTVTYGTLARNTALLISTGYADRDLRFFEKQPLQSDQGNPDKSRFILEQTIYDAYFTAYSRPERCAQIMTMPT